jgi:uncharacterized protein DUF6456
MNAEAKHGFDGQAPEFRLKRGSEVRDPKTGAVIREAEMGRENINVDRLAWLLAHRRIETHQHDAGRRLQGDWEVSKLENYASLQGGRGGSGTNLLPDVKCDAIDRVNAARIAVGHTGWKIIDMVALQNISLEKTASIIRVKPSSASTGLQVALDALASHYGLST